MDINSLSMFLINDNSQVQYLELATGLPEFSQTQIAHSFLDLTHLL